MPNRILIYTLFVFWKQHFSLAETDLCEDSVVDAATINHENRTLLFKGDTYWILKNAAGGFWYLESVKGHLANTTFPGLPRDVDAAFTVRVKRHQEKTIFIKDHLAYSYVFATGKYSKEEPAPRDIRSLFGGAWNRLGKLKAAITLQEKLEDEDEEKRGQLSKVLFLFKSYFFLLELSFYPHEFYLLEHGATKVDGISFFQPSRLGRVKRAMSVFHIFSKMDITAIEMGWNDENPTSLLYFTANGQYISLPNMKNFKESWTLFQSGCHPVGLSKTYLILNFMVLIFHALVVIIAAFFGLAKLLASGKKRRHIKYRFHYSPKDRPKISISGTKASASDGGKQILPQQLKRPLITATMSTQSAVESQKTIESTESYGHETAKLTPAKTDVLFKREAPKFGATESGPTLSMLLQKLKASKVPPSNTSWYVQL